MRELSLLLIAVVASAPAQMRINLRTQSKDVDFSTASVTKPVKTGSLLPTRCTEGEMFLLLPAPAGGSLYVCASTDQWTVQNGGVNLPSAAGNAGRIMSSDGSALVWATAGGDLSGTATASTVVGIRQHGVSATAPSSGEVLIWDITSQKWEPRLTGGDVSGPADGATVTALRNRTVSTTAPLGGQTLIWNDSAGVWEPQNIPVGMGSLTLQSNGTPIGTRATQNLIAGLGMINVVTDATTRLDVQQSIDTAVVETHAIAQAGQSRLCSSGGSGPAFACMLAPTLTAYTTGMVLHWIPAASNTGAAITLNVDELGSRVVKAADGSSDPAAGAILAGRLYPLWYDGTVFRLLSSSGVMVEPATTRPDCDASLRGRMWHTLGDGTTKDEVAICAKDAGGSYSWRVLY